jgi:hypothetical protein
MSVILWDYEPGHGSLCALVWGNSLGFCLAMTCQSGLWLP